ncbi:MAG TPA: Rrf2 family transcriptional regulator [Anaeromyxobacteraceae bacterium]|nr:Rrf2 family transcriptional regulator [Anaeromyxobacteraceae bacterium]
MILSASAAHALRALAFMAHGPGDRPLRGQEMARKLKVPAPYLSKVLATLARAGLLRASRGVNGGYRLARPARQIRLIEVVEPFEGPRARPGCLLRPGEPCLEEEGCPTHEFWADVKERYVRFLERTTVADIRGSG